MKNGAIFCWVVLITHDTGKHWFPFNSRRLARAFAHLEGGEIYRVERTH